MGSSTIVGIDDEPGNAGSQAQSSAIPVETFTPAQKWSRLNHAVAVFRLDLVGVGWLRVGPD
jgi:hypothetical protein